MRLNHIAIAVKDLSQAVSIYHNKIGASLGSRHVVESEGIEIAVINLDNTEIELMMPINNTGGVAKFIEKRGEGLHHICFEIDNIEETIKSLSNSGLKIIDTKPVIGYKGNKAFFVHPSSTDGVLLEFYEKR
ncbi:MAG: methylmalonyl-CoA epimerase [Deltaproteobacteria bacterium]|nr:methylmalonyl-CoA epimerase [Deltaproteobacteria bacterium]MCL5792113.1 methylmalonyl-CoA epimerase [Deltaproteobacteria bacterium]